MKPTLLVEVGGTHTRCALTDGKIHSVAVFRNIQYPHLTAVLSRYFDDTAGDKPAEALIAVAAPVTGGSVRLTNLGWLVDAAQLESEFALERVHLVNDFAALACAVPFLAEADMIVLKPGQEGNQNQNKAVIGPGTGLGVSGLIHCRGRWVPICGEGGHVTLAAVDAREAAVVKRLRQRFGHVSAERVLSGPGLLNLYTALAGSADAQTPEDVTRLARHGDRVAAEALDLFFRFLGTTSADLVLTLGARGGLYLGGGILPALAQYLADSGFLTRFLSKGRYSDYLSNISVSLIVSENPALEGLGHYPDLLLEP